MRSANACLHIFAKNNLTAGNNSDPCQYWSANISMDA